MIASINWTEFVNLLLNPLSNAIMTLLAGITAIYWIFTFIAGDLFGDADADVDLDIHGADIDTDTDPDLQHDVPDKSWFAKGLEYLNVGKVPFMVVLSTFKFIAWIGTLASSVVFGLGAWGWKSVFILVPVFLLTFFLTRFATKPLIKVYKTMGYHGEEGHELLGRIARMRSSISGSKIGAAELVVKTEVMRINVKSKSGDPIAYDAEVMISDESPDKKYYLVVPEVNLGNIV